MLIDPFTPYALAEDLIAAVVTEARTVAMIEAAIVAALLIPEITHVMQEAMREQKAKRLRTISMAVAMMAMI